MAKKKDIRDMSNDQLTDQLPVLRKDLFNYEIEKLSGQLADTSQISKTKKNIARVKTLINKFNKDEEATNA